MKTKKHKSLGQVAYEARHEITWPSNSWNTIAVRSDWHRVARAVVRAAKVKRHLNSAAKTKHK